MDISVVMVTYGLLDMTLKTIKHLNNGLNHVKSELIIIDNGSTDSEREQLAKVADVFICNDSNVGFIASNQGMKIAQGKVFFISNNDLIACNDWYNRLSYHLQFYDIVGPVSNAIFGEQLLPLPYKNYDEFVEKADILYERRKHKGLLTYHIGCGCAFIPRYVYEKIGGFHDFGLGGCEDSDYCIRAKQNGFKLGIALDTFFHHYYNQTYKTLKIDYQKENRKSVEKLKEVYGKDYYRELFRRI